MICSLKYFYFLDEARQNGKLRQVHLLAREYGIHILMICIMIAVTESIMEESKEVFKFNTT